MTERYKIECAKADNRDILITLLGRNGYTVRQIRLKEKNKYKYYVEYWKEGEGNAVL